MSRYKFRLETTYDNSVSYLETMRDVKQEIKERSRKDKKQITDFIIANA